MNQPDGSAPAAAAAAQADESNSSGRRSSSSRECLKRSPRSPKAEGSDSVTSQSSPSEEAGMMTEVKVKTEVPDDYIEEVIWQDDTKDSKKNIKDGPGDVPAEICVVIGGVRNQQTLDGKAVERGSPVGYTRNRYSGTWIFDHALRYTSGSYECGICGKKYKYYNCFQTHVRAHRDTEAASGEGASQGSAPLAAEREKKPLSRAVFVLPWVESTETNNFRYTCDICGKKYKYYSCFQEHRDLHAVDDPYDQAVIAADEVKEEEPEPFQKIGPKTGNYTCEFCGKQYKYYTPYQEHVALHAPIKFSRSPLFVAVKTQASQSSKKSPASINRCSTLLHRTPSGVPPASQSQMFRAPNSGSPGSKAITAESAFSRRVEGKAQNNFEETNSNSQNSSAGHSGTEKPKEKRCKQNPSETASPLISNPFPLLQKPYTCGACGIQFQFYNNLLEHMQSHAADNENNIASSQPRSPLPVVEEKWKPQLQRNNANNTSASGSVGNSAIPEKERQNIAERLLRVMCTDLGALSVVSGKEFIKLAQTLVDSGARYGAFSVTEILGNFNTLALKHLPRMYNQVKVKVTCALGSNACLGIGVTCHSQSVGPDSCYILTAYQVEGNHIKSYVLGIKGVDLRDNGDFIHHWVQNVLSEFVMSEIRTVYVTDCKVNSSAFSKAGMCLRCSACALNSVVQSVLNKRTLQARNMHEVIELLNVCEDLAGSTGLSKETFGSLEETSPPPCWNSVTDSLLLVHERYEQICEFYSRAKKMNLIQNLNKHLLSNLAAILAPVKQAVIELSNESRPTLQLVLPTYVKLEKLFTSKANDAGVVSKLCHLFLEALKENFKVHSAHKVAMILDPQQKLRPVPPYQHEEIIGKVCELINEVKESWAEETEFEPSTKKPRAAGEATAAQEEDWFGKNEVYDYLQEPLFQATPDLFQYWSCVTQKHTKLAKLAFWLLAVPAVGARSECVNMCEQALLIKRRRLLSPEDMNKLMFLKSNML
ncbi:zinc finger protein 618 isoform X1 [Corvus cornix cornix]|uniref:zinc finger protein 618 isoform X4 n=1 Tax=Corvus moneduloides TaxID=1196302 RepID=UPI0013627907|nr:zinc finger protein 618 isoform X4 [Corvus moneduloides]XP_039417755.1 zinc finger protein 618 isoform X1 [Corvus cornix cornix]XP_041908673.1 zinc finger protein 618 isoform X1 [Corvus kubaryi]XP_048181071.1 zinc finger protein 618 isoform X1 [Corvus hawaiiensis]